MEYQEAKNEFIAEWGSLATKWGINRTMAQIHALLLVSPNSLTTDEIMAELQISRGNANTNVRSLIEWNLVKKKLIKGQRKEHFEAEKDMEKMAFTIAMERKKREIEPIIEVLEKLKNIEGNTEAEKEFKTVLGGLHNLVASMNTIVEKTFMTQKTFTKWILKLMR